MSRKPQTSVTVRKIPNKRQHLVHAAPKRDPLESLVWAPFISTLGLGQELQAGEERISSLRLKLDPEASSLGSLLPGY